MPDMCVVTTVDIVTTYDPETMTDVTGPDSSTEMMQTYLGTDAATQCCLWELDIDVTV